MFYPSLSGWLVSDKRWINPSIFHLFFKPSLKQAGVQNLTMVKKTKCLTAIVSNIVSLSTTSFILLMLLTLTKLGNSVLFIVQLYSRINCIFSATRLFQILLGGQLYLFRVISRPRFSPLSGRGECQAKAFRFQS